ncbi:MAG: hypothetical protein WBP75_05400 [Candidatus Cybelea sp.]
MRPDSIDRKGLRRTDVPGARVIHEHVDAFDLSKNLYGGSVD